ncbi:MAG: hypothetical protein EB015_12875 [Methylocystaceae bacterium]|jgi:hypothetical protein|nr:hypothetical protein [Methylocystaceae bacterium]UOF77665.1 hypothetical protein [Caudoviricetes sp.]
MLNCYTWSTTKTSTGFAWRVCRFDRADIRKLIVLREGVCATRAQAMGQAKRIVLFYRKTVK